MGLFRFIGKVAGRIVDVRVDRWVSLNYLTDSFQQMKHSVRYLFVPARPLYHETFEEAIIRLSLTEQDLQARLKEFRYLTRFFLSLAGVLVCYTLYLVIKLSVLGTLISVCLSLFCLAQAFRFHFWSFQIQQKKLGCSVEEWLKATRDKFSP
jgi:intracellular multiplication protein IcmV